MAGLRRVFVLVNPVAGGRGGLHTLEQLTPALERAGFAPEAVVSERAGHGWVVARELNLRGLYAVLAIGGDGTFHEVLNGLIENPGSSSGKELPILAPVPTGSGNALARDLDIRGYANVVEALQAERTRAIDIARVCIDGRTVHAANVIGWGLMARVNRRAEGMRWARGHRYVLASLMALSSAQLGWAEAALDGSRDETDLFGSVSVTRYSGKGMMIAPRAVLDDGKLDLVVVTRGGRLRLAALLARVFSGKHVRSPLVRYAMIDRLDLELEPGAELLVDGEMLPAKRVEIRVASRALTVCAGRDSHAGAGDG